jgi:hypothetical protein
MPVQTTFSETMRQGLPGMINKMVLYNAVSRNCSVAAGIPAARAVSQSAINEVDATIGGTLAAFLGITILDPTIVSPTTGTPLADGVYPQTTEIGILTQGEIFATSVVATTIGDPVHFVAVDGTLTNTGAIGPIPGARWKFTRLAGELNVVQLGIQR